MSQGQTRRIPVQEAVLTTGGETYKVQVWDGGVNLFVDKNHDGVFQPSEALYSSIETRHAVDRFNRAGIQGNLVGAVLRADYELWRQTRQALNSSERWDGKASFTSRELEDVVAGISNVMDKEMEALNSRNRPPTPQPKREKRQPDPSPYYREERVENGGVPQVPDVRPNGTGKAIV